MSKGGEGGGEESEEDRRRVKGREEDERREKSGSSVNERFCDVNLIAFLRRLFPSRLHAPGAQAVMKRNRQNPNC